MNSHPRIFSPLNVSPRWVLSPLAVLAVAVLSLGLLTSSASAVVTPVANDDMYSTDEEVVLVVPAPGVLENDQPGIYNLLTAQLVSPPSWGGLGFARDGSFTYSPGTDFNGADSFTYRVYDNGIMGSIATVTINVAGVNDVPVTQRDGTYIALPGVPLDIGAAEGVLANDSDPEGDLLTAVVLTEPAHGTLTLNPDGSFTYTASEFYRGGDSFTYSATDGNGGASTNFAALSVEDGVDLYVGGVVNPEEVEPGAAASFLFTVWSQGTAGAEGASLSVTLASGFSAATLTPSIGSYDAVTGIWTLGSLAPTTSATIEIAATVDAAVAPGAVLDVTVAVTGLTSTDINPRNDSATVGVTVVAPPEPPPEPTPDPTPIPTPDPTPTPDGDTPPGDGDGTGDEQGDDTGDGDGTGDGEAYAACENPTHPSTAALCRVAEHAPDAAGAIIERVLIEQHERLSGRFDEGDLDRWDRAFESLQKDRGYDRDGVVAPDDVDDAHDPGDGEWHDDGAGEPDHDSDEDAGDHSEASLKGRGKKR